MGVGAHHAVRWFEKWEREAAFARGRANGVALHRFRHDPRRLGFRQYEPIGHVLPTDHARLVAFAARLGLRVTRIEPPRPNRPDHPALRHIRA